MRNVVKTPIGDKSPLVFVCHDLGGVILKEVSIMRFPPHIQFMCKVG